MRRFIGRAVAAGLVLLVSGTAAASADTVMYDGQNEQSDHPGSGRFEASSTTLDACGYFVGTQTPTSDSKRTSNGITYDTQHGTWTGVYNNYSHTLVKSLGPVSGAFTQVTQTAANGTVTGTESFTSRAGRIDQTFTYGPSVPGYYSVTVTATGRLAFLTSSTDGHCYSGPFPRP